MTKLNASFTVDRCDEKTAESFWQSCSATTIFCHPTVLAKLAHQVDWWLACVDGVAVCAWPVCLDISNAVIVPEFSYYVGPFWSDASRKVGPQTRLVMDVIVYQGMLKRLLQKYGRVQFSLTPGNQDVRTFLWFPEQTGVSAEIDVRARYTACIENLRCATSERLIQNFGQNRRRDVRIGARSDLIITESASFDALYLMYAKTMAKDPALAERRKASVAALVELVTMGFGYLLIGSQNTTTPGTNEACSIWLVLYGKSRACCVISAADPAWRDQRFNPWSCHQAMLRAQSLGLDCFDFNGANSFDRGLDKHSFGAHAQLYFDLNIKLV